MKFRVYMLIVTDFSNYVVGDLIVISSRRTLTHRMSQAGDKVFGYLFTDPEAVVFPEFAPPAVPGSLGGEEI